MGMLGTLATELLFGFSQNFAWAIAARFLWGLLNGNLGVSKTYISEVQNHTSIHIVHDILCLCVCVCIDGTPGLYDHALIMWLWYHFFYRVLEAKYVSVSLTHHYELLLGDVTSVWSKLLRLHVPYVLIPVYVMQICDDTNQANGFAAVGTTAGLGRLCVSSRVQYLHNGNMR